MANWKDKFKNGSVPDENDYRCLIELAETSGYFGFFGKQLAEAESKNEARAALGVVDPSPFPPLPTPTVELYTPSYCRVGNLLIQWGSTTLTNNGIKVINLPITFSTAAGVHVTKQDTGTGIPYAYFTNNSRITVGISGTGVTISWVAFGYA